MKTASKCLIYNSATNSIVCCHPTGRPWKEKGSNNPAKGVFNLPGGEIDEGETPEDAMIREIKEELSYTLDKSRLQHIGPYDYTKDKNWEVFFYSVEDDFDIKKLKCDSFFSTSDGKILPEVNGFAWIEIESKLDWINFAAQKVIKKVLKDYGDKLFNTLDKQIDNELESLEEQLGLKKTRFYITYLREIYNPLDYPFLLLNEQFSKLNLKWIVCLFNEMYEKYKGNSINNLLSFKKFLERKLNENKPKDFPKIVFNINPNKFETFYQGKYDQNSNTLIFHCGLQIKNIFVLKDNFNSWLQNIKSSIIHEIGVHKHQLDLRGLDIDNSLNYYIPEKESEEELLKYQFQKDEIQAFARQYVSYLKNLNISEKEILENIRTEKGLKYLGSLLAKKFNIKKPYNAMLNLFKTNNAQNRKFRDEMYRALTIEPLEENANYIDEAEFEELIKLI